MRTAAKTMVKLFGRAYGKTRRFFIMKRAAGLIIGARFFKRNRFVYDVDNINAIK